jgi:phosphate transporter
MHELVETATPFTQESKAKVSNAIARLTDLYAKCVTNGDKSAAQQQLKLYQREHIAWERNTVWRQMIGQQRRGPVDGLGVLVSATLEQPEERSIIDVPTPLGSLKLTKKRLSLTIAVTVFIALLNMDIVAGEEANKCLAVLVFSTIMWATEVCIVRWLLFTAYLRALGDTLVRYLDMRSPPAGLLTSHPR